MKSLLLLTDFSESGNHAVEYGYHLAKHLKMNVVLCNSIDIINETNMLWPAEAYPDMVADSEAELQKLKEYLEHMDLTAGFHPGICGESKLGRLADVAEMVMNEIDISMVVIGTHRKGFARFLLENHAKSLIDSLNCPVLIVPQEAQPGEIKKIAFATDFKDHKRDLKSVYQLIPIAEQMGAKILLAHIHKGNLESIKKAEEAFLTEISNKANYPHIFYSCVENDNTEEGLCHLCDIQQVDLLVMLHRSRDFFEQIFDKSNTHTMAGKIKVPLMVIPG